MAVARDVKLAMNHSLHCLAQIKKFASSSIANIQDDVHVKKLISLPSRVSVNARCDDIAITVP